MNGPPSRASNLPMPDTDALVVLTTLGTSGGVRAHLAHPLLGEGVGHEVNA